MTHGNRRRSSPHVTTTVAVVLLGLAIPGLSGPAASQNAVEANALDRYVAKADSAYSWRLHAASAHEHEGAPYLRYVLELTSQAWRPAYEVDQPLWTHWLSIIKPQNVTKDTGLLYIGSGRNGRAAPTSVRERTLRLALETGSVVAELGQVPNQPLHFADSRGHGRFEDDLIAYSRVKYIVTGDEEWLVRLAMVKSAVRALDAVQEFLASDAGGGLEVNDFVVAGASKRGWTTWLVGMVDERVRAIMPLVIDALNTEAVTRKHFAANGFFSNSLGDYVRHGLYPHMLGTPEMARILAIEDPYHYRNRKSMELPKFVVNATGDQYFLPDNSRLYFGALPGEKHLRYVPNAKHNLAGSDALESMIAYYDAVLREDRRPRFSWEIDDRGWIRVEVEDEPREVLLWTAHNPESRDLRLDVIGPAWTSAPLEQESPGVYVAQPQAPEAGYAAFMVELTYDSGGPYPFKFTTDVSVLPQTLPYSIETHDGPWLQRHQEQVREEP